MKKIRLVAAAGAAAALTAVGASAATAATPKLVASVSDPANISLTLAGKKVTKLKAGKYTILVKDTSSSHNFHLTGPGVNKSTAVGAKQTVTWKVTLKKGTYKFVCDPHSSFMKGAVKVS